MEILILMETLILMEILILMETLILLRISSLNGVFLFVTLPHTMKWFFISSLPFVIFFIIPQLPKIDRFQQRFGMSLDNAPRILCLRDEFMSVCFELGFRDRQTSRCQAEEKVIVVICEKFVTFKVKVFDGVFPSPRFSTGPTWAKRGSAPPTIQI